MPTISIQRRHKLEHKKAKAAAQKIAKDLHQRFDLQCTWDGDNVSFQRPGLSGQMRLGKNDVELNVQNVKQLDGIVKGLRGIAGVHDVQRLSRI